MDVLPPKPAQDSILCGHCGAAMPKVAAFCPGCGRSMTPLASGERIAATVAYLPLLLPAAVVLFLPAFRRSQFVRFHAWQSVLLWGMFLVLTVVALLFSNIAGAIVFLLIGILASLAMFFLWAVLTLKSWQGERFELPVFGQLAGRLS